MSAPQEGSRRVRRLAICVVALAVVAVAVDTATTTNVHASPVQVTSPRSTGLQSTSVAGVSASVIDAGGLQAAVRVVVPAAAADFVNRSTCRGDATTSVMTMSIPEISYRCPVSPGGQATIDAGFATLVTEMGGASVLATRPGAPGTLWIAAHRSSHGGAFAGVPDLTDGATVTISDERASATYRIVGRARVQVRNGLVLDAAGQATQAATMESVARTDRGNNMAPRLLLQTCDGEHFRWMIYADLIES
jgi:hypothetical protein